MDAAHRADLVKTDVWTSMGFEAENDQGRRDFAAWQVSPEMMRVARPGALFMPCLPVHRGDEHIAVFYYLVACQGAVMKTPRHNPRTSPTALTRSDSRTCHVDCHTFDAVHAMRHREQRAAIARANSKAVSDNLHDPIASRCDCSGCR